MFWYSVSPKIPANHTTVMTVLWFAGIFTIQFYTKKYFHYSMLYSMWRISVIDWHNFRTDSFGKQSLQYSTFLHRSVDAIETVFNYQCKDCGVAGLIWKLTNYDRLKKNPYICVRRKIKTQIAADRITIGCDAHI